MQSLIVFNSALSHCDILRHANGMPLTCLHPLDLLLRDANPFYSLFVLPHVRQTNFDGTLLEMYVFPLIYDFYKFVT